MRFPRWLFFSLALALLLAAVIWPISYTLKGLDDEKMEAHAPFWLTSRGAGAAILVNNTAPHGFAFRLRLHGPDGILLHSQEHFADSAASLTIPVSDRLDGPLEAGYAVLEYPAQFGGYLPAQMVVSSPEEGVSANYLFLEKGSSSSQRMHWAFWIPSGQSDLYIMLVNRSEAPIEAKIASRADKREVADEVRIAPGAMHRLRLGELLLAGLRPGLAGGISLSHSGGPGDLLAEGFMFDPERGISYTLDRFELEAPGSANLVFPLLLHGTMKTGGEGAAFRPLAVLSNGSASPLEVQPLIRLEGGQEALLESWVLGPFESTAVDLHRLLRRKLPSLTSFEGPLELSHSGVPGDLAATVLIRGPGSDRIYQSTVKQDSHLSPGYSYPFRLSEGWNTRIYLSNRSSERVTLCVFLHFDGQSYTWLGSKQLEPFESRSIDIGRLRDEQVPDEFGRLIPLETESGQAILVVHDEEPSRVAAQAVLENAENGLAIPASCSICPPSDIKLYLRRNLNDPEGVVASYVGFPGEKERIFAVVRNSLGGEKDVSSSASYSSSDPGIAKVKKSLFKAEVEFLQPGLAEEIGAVFSGCWYAPPLGECGGFFEEGECGCFCQSVPLDVPEGGLFSFANPAAEVLVLQPTIAITAPRTVKDGLPTTFEVLSNATPTAYEWSFTAPPGAGNNPNVNFDSATSASTDAEGKWFALPNRECPATSLNSTYTINCKLTFTSSYSRTVSTVLTMTLPPGEGGLVDTNESMIAGFPSLQERADGTWFVSSMGNMSRVLPTKQIFVVGQFVNKINVHETEHLAHFASGHPLFGSVDQPADFFERIKDFTAATESALNSAIQTEFQIYDAEQETILKDGENESERLAYGKSDPIAPKFVYQNCSRY